MPPCFAFLWLAAMGHLIVSRHRRNLCNGGFVLLVFAGVQLGVMPFFAPTLQYGNRLMLPIYLALYPFGGHLLWTCLLRASTAARAFSSRIHGHSRYPSN